MFNSINHSTSAVASPISQSGHKFAAQSNSLFRALEPSLSHHSLKVKPYHSVSMNSVHKNVARDEGAITFRDIDEVLAKSMPQKAENKVHPIVYRAENEKYSRFAIDSNGQISVNKMPTSKKPVRELFFGVDSWERAETFVMNINNKIHKDLKHALEKVQGLDAKSDAGHELKIDEVKARQKFQAVVDDAKNHVVKLKSFAIKASYLDTLRSTSVTEGEVKKHAKNNMSGPPIVVDQSKATDQYGLRTLSHFSDLEQNMIQGTGITYNFKGSFDKLNDTTSSFLVRSINWEIPKDL